MRVEPPTITTSLTSDRLMPASSSTCPRERPRARGYDFLLASGVHLWCVHATHLFDRNERLSEEISTQFLEFCARDGFGEVKARQQGLDLHANLPTRSKHEAHAIVPNKPSQARSACPSACALIWHAHGPMHTHLWCSRERALGSLYFAPQLLHGSGSLGRVLPRELFLDEREQVLDQPVVQVFAAKVRVSCRSQHLATGNHGLVQRAQTTAATPPCVLRANDWRGEVRLANNEPTCTSRCFPTLHREESKRRRKQAIRARRASAHLEDARVNREQRYIEGATAQVEHEHLGSNTRHTQRVVKPCGQAYTHMRR